jgi:hypothetical protein
MGSFNFHMILEENDCIDHEVAYVLLVDNLFSPAYRVVRR